MAIIHETTRTAVLFDDPLPPHMIVKTIALKRKFDGETYVVNATDWKTPSFPEEDFEVIKDYKPAAPALVSSTVPKALPYVADDLLKKSSKDLQTICEELGLVFGQDLPKNADKNAIVQAIINKQAG